MKKKELLKNWEEETNIVTREFVRKYFGKDADYYWIADDVGGVLNVGDYFFNLDRIIESIRYSATIHDLFTFYDMEMDSACGLTDKLSINFRTFIKLNRSKK